ncbi:MAG: hypothetical protein Q8K63_04425 [Acidimicrobiales bacterium]|nr:hypothetical protein [Acidimicrobiales bacterium]
MLLDEVAIVGAGRTPFTRVSGRTTGAMAADAVRSALADAGLLAGDVDGMVSYQAGDSTPTAAVARAVGVQELAWYADLFGGGNVVVTCLGEAARAVATGACEVAVAYRSMNGRSGRRFGTATGQGPFSVGGELQFGGPVGYLVPPQWMAMWAARHQYTYGSTCEDLEAHREPDCRGHRRRRVHHRLRFTFVHAEWFLAEHRQSTGRHLLGDLPV